MHIICIWILLYVYINIFRHSRFPRLVFQWKLFKLRRNLWRWMYFVNVGTLLFWLQISSSFVCALYRLFSCWAHAHSYTKSCARAYWCTHFCLLTHTIGRRIHPDTCSRLEIESEYCALVLTWIRCAPFSTTTKAKTDAAWSCVCLS